MSRRSKWIREGSWLCLLAAAWFAPAPAKADVAARASIDVSADTDVDSVSVFYDELSPYGEWVEADDVGHVWRPYTSVVGVGFVPYASHGHWVDSDVGWVFVSHWDWGWATFHYGSWHHQSRLGWVWLPGTTWAPAWVQWRVGPTYVGWAPLGLHVALWGPGWTFVHKRHFARHDFHRYSVPHTRAGLVFRGTLPLRARVYTQGRGWSRGPASRDIERASGYRPQRARVWAPTAGRVERRSALQYEGNRARRGHSVGSNARQDRSSEVRSDARRDRRGEVRFNSRGDREDRRTRFASSGSDAPRRSRAVRVLGEGRFATERGDSRRLGTRNPARAASPAPGADDRSPITGRGRHESQGDSSASRPGDSGANGRRWSNRTQTPSVREAPTRSQRSSSSARRATPRDGSRARPSAGTRYEGRGTASGASRTRSSGQRARSSSSRRSRP